MAKLSETFSKAFDVMEVEKNAVLGLPQPLLELYDCPVYKTVLKRMQGFFSTLYDNCFHILGNAGPSLQQDFYAVDGLAGQLITAAFINLANVPDYRLRPMLRLFMKQLVLSCPPQYYNTLMCPILGPLFAYLLQRLTQKWQVINQRSSLCNSEDELPEENPMSQEMLEEQLVRLLTREVMDLLSVCCIVKRGSEAAGAKEDELEEGMMATDASQAPQPATYTLDELTELGKCLLKNEDIGTTFLTIVYSSLSWKDTITCQRMTTQVCWPLLKQVISGSLLPDAVTWFYGAVLRGLQMHGQHEGCNAALIQLAFLTYETLRPRFPELRTVMEQIPQIQMDCLDQFDLKVLNPEQQKTADKKRKDIFRRLISGTVGKPLGQQFKKEVHIKNLPSLFKKTKPEPTLDILDSDSAGLATLFSPDTDDI